MPGSMNHRLNALFGDVVPGRLQIITSCTGLKVALAGTQRTPAEHLYLGQQHVQLMSGVKAYRATANLDLYIVSAKYGLVSGAFRLPAYDETFSGLGKRAIKEKANSVALPASMESVLSAPADATIVLPGRDYLTASQLASMALGDEQRVYFVGGASIGRMLPSGKSVFHALLNASDKTLFRSGEIALKGAVVGQYLKRLAGIS